MQLYAPGRSGIHASLLQVQVYFVLIYGRMERIVDASGQNMRKLLDQHIHFLGSHDERPEIWLKHLCYSRRQTWLPQAQFGHWSSHLVRLDPWLLAAAYDVKGHRRLL